MFNLSLTCFGIFTVMFKQNILYNNLFPVIILTIVSILLLCLFKCRFYNTRLNLSLIEKIKLSFCFAALMFLAICYLYSIHLWVMHYLTETVSVILLGSIFTL